MLDTIAALLTWTVTHSAYAMPSIQPELTFRSASHFLEVACQSREPCRARGYYRDGSHLLVLHESYRGLETIEQQALTVHELTHFLQDLSGRWPATKTCDSWIAREREAFKFQLRYIARMAARPNFRYRMPKLDRASCEKASVSAGAAVRGSDRVESGGG